MSHIGYRRTKQQVQARVQAIIKKNICPNPFTHNWPGKKSGGNYL